MWAPTSPKPNILVLVNHIDWPASLEQFLRAIWDAVSQAAVLILPQIKLKLTSLTCNFLKSTVGQGNEQKLIQRSMK